MQSQWFQRYVADTGFLQRYPFYAGVLAQLDFEPSTRVPVMGVRWRAGRFTLLVNEAFFSKRMRFCAGVLLHEVHHLVLGHLTRAGYCDVARPDLLLLAMEVSANEYIAEPLPGPIVWQDFRAQGLERHQTTLGRYELLLAGEGGLDRKLIDEVNRFDDHGGHGEGGAGILDLLAGRAPSGAGAVLHVLMRRARQHVARAADLREVPFEAPAPEDMATQSRETQSPETPRDSERALRKKAAAALAARAAVATSGLLGRDVEDVIAEFAPATGPARVDWRSALAAFASRGPTHDWQRPNRRQPHRVFELPGRSWRGGEPQLLVAIDTSASMGVRELAAIARELAQVAAMAAVTIVECDSRVRRVYRFRGSLDDACGRGDTDLRPPFAPDLLRRHGRDGIVYFTDGQGPWPMTAPPVPLLWVLVGDCPFDCPFGQRAYLQVEPAGDLEEIPF